MGSMKSTPFEDINHSTPRTDPCANVQAVQVPQLRVGFPS